jgi:hypothetical protein
MADDVNAQPTRGVSSPLWLRVGFWACTLIAIAVVVRRLVALEFPTPSGPSQLAGLDVAFASHSALTLAHILPALAFVAVAPFAVFSRFAYGGWAERLLFPLGAIVGVTAYAMSVYSVGGWIERSAVLFFNSLFLFSLVRAWLHKARGQTLQKRRWVVRAVGVVLGIATTRPVIGVFFATSRLTHLSPSQFFGIAFWIGFSINWIVVESWLRFKRPTVQVSQP